MGVSLSTLPTATLATSPEVAASIDFSSLALLLDSAGAGWGLPSVLAIARPDICAWAAAVASGSVDSAEAANTVAAAAVSLLVGLILGARWRPSAGGAESIPAVLTESEERLRHILAASMDGIWDWDMAAKQSWWSPQLHRLLGMQETGENIYPAGHLRLQVHPEDRPQVDRALKAHLQNCEPYSIEIRIRRADGSYGWFASKGEALRDPKGRPYRMVGFLCDITQRKRAELALRASEAKQRAIIQALPDLLTRMDSTGVVLDFYPADDFPVLASSEQVVGYPVELHLPAPLAEQRVKAVTAAIDTGEVQRYEQTLQIEGQVRVEEVRAAAMSADEAIVIIRDITSLKRAERALAESEAKLSRVLNNAAASIIQLRVYLDQRWEYEYCSPGCEFLYGYTTEELLADPPLWNARVLPEDMAKVIGPSFEKTFAGITHQTEFRFRHKDGSIRWIRAQVSPTWDEVRQCWLTTIVNLNFTEEKRAELALRQSEAKQRALIQALPDLLMRVDRHGRVSDFWPTDMFRVIGTPETVVGSYLSEFLPENLVQRRREAITAAIESGCLQVFEQTVLLEEQHQTEEVRVAPLGDSEAIVLVRDISDRKRTEAALAESEAKLREILSSTAASICQVWVDCDYNWGYEYLSPGGERLYGYTSEEISQSPHLWMSRVHPEDRATVIQHSFEQVLAGQPHQHAFRFFHRDGSQRWIRAIVTPVWHLERSCWLATIVNLNITEEKRALLALRRSEAEQRAIINALPDLLIRFNRQGEQLALWSSPDFPQWVQGETLGKNVRELLPPGQAEQRIKAITAALETGTTQIYEQTLPFADGLHTEEVRVVASGANEAIVLIRDITERKQAEQALAVAKEEAESANAAKSLFLANVSHELRSPLNAILGFAQLLEQEPLAPEHQSQISIIRRSGEYLLKVINQVLDFAKVEAAQTQLNSTDFDFWSLLNDIESMFSLRAQTKGLTMVMERGEALPQRLCTDEVKLRQVLINLLDNALKFTDAGRITLAVALSSQTSADALHLEFRVSDTGAGIAPDEQKLVFQAFRQTQCGQQQQQGTGLGLAISQHFIQLMGGEIALKSELGCGTTFCFNIAARAATTTAMTPERRQVLGLLPGQPTYRLLVVDDSPFNRLLLTKLLARLGLEVQEAENGEVAVNIWSDWQPHLILMDLRMPHLDGYSATRQIRDRTPMHLPPPVIIAVSATGGEDSTQSAFAAGCNDFVYKPFKQAEIFDILQRYLGLRYRYE